MSRMLLIFSYDFPPSNGGIARLCQEIASGMQTYYSNVKVLTRKRNENFIKSNGFEIIKLPSQRFKCEIKATQYLLNIENKDNVDVLCGLWHPEATLAILTGFKNVFVLGHGTEFLHGESVFRKHIWLPIYAKWVLGKVKLNIANSVYTRGLIYKINPKSKSEALPLGVNSFFFKPLETNRENDEKFKIASLSRIEQFKGYDFIAKTIAGLPFEYKKKVEWNIGGTGPYLKELKILIEELGIQKYVHFHGFIPDDELPNFYNSNNIFVLCTREKTNSVEVEGFGLVFLEAQSCGIPVIGTNTGGISDAIENGNGGWIIQQDSNKELTNLLIYLLDNKNVINEQGKMSRKRVEQFATWDIYCSKLNNLMKT